MGLLQLLNQFFEPHTEPTPGEGHIYWVPVQEILHVPRILSVVRTEPDEHKITDFKIEEINASHFKRQDKLPVKQLNLSPTTELVVSKAKLRPAVVIGTACVNDLDTLQDPANKRIANKSFNTPLYVLAPFYSVSSMKNPGTFGPEFVDRIRHLKYPNLFCVPDFQNEEKEVPASIIRLDQLFVSHLQRGSENTQIKFHDDILDIFKLQLSVFLDTTNDEMANDFIELQAAISPD